MRPEKAKYLITKSFEAFIKTKNTSVLYCVLPAIRKLSDKCKNDGDPRTGSELFFEQNQEQILSHLEYISDRFYAQHRLTWLLYVLENKLI